MSFFRNKEQQGGEGGAPRGQWGKSTIRAVLSRGQAPQPGAHRRLRLLPCAGSLLRVGDVPSAPAGCLGRWSALVSALDLDEERKPSARALRRARVRLGTAPLRGCSSGCAESRVRRTVPRTNAHVRAFSPRSTSSPTCAPGTPRVFAACRSVQRALLSEARSPHGRPLSALRRPRPGEAGPRRRQRAHHGAASGCETAPGALGGTGSPSIRR